MATLPNQEAHFMLQKFTKQQARGGFLSSFFNAKPGSTGKYASEFSWDIERPIDSEAGTRQRNAGSHANSSLKYTTKGSDLPHIAEHVPINIGELTTREAGEDRYTTADVPFFRRFVQRANRSLIQVSNLITNAMEDQAAQWLQTGTLTTPGEVPFSLDLLPKAAQMAVAVGTPWSTAATCTPIDDIVDVAKVIMTNSNLRVGIAVFGTDAAAEFQASTQVQNRADIVNFNVVQIDPQLENRGASMFGRINFGGYVIDCWQYDRSRIPYGGGASTPFLGAGNVVLLPRRDQAVDDGLTVVSAREPVVLPPEVPITSMLNIPTQAEGGWDLTPNAWTDPERRTLNVGFRTNALLLPQYIDAIGSLVT